MTAEEMGALARFISKLRASGVGVLLVAHTLPLVMETCDQVLVMDEGRLIAKDLPRKVLEHEDVIRAYLGSEWKNPSA
jgi:ABC-type branched-subunit amino acid transport system ATPase component